MSADFDIQRPATEVEIAEVIRWAADFDANIVRRLAFERDTLKESAAKAESTAQQAALSLIEGLIDNWDEWDAEAQQAAQQDQDERSHRFVMRSQIANYLWRSFGWRIHDMPDVDIPDAELMLHPKVDTAWASQTLPTETLLDVLRRNHLSMRRNDSPYWQAEQKIRDLLATIDMIASLASLTCDPDDVRLDEIRRLVEGAHK